MSKFWENSLRCIFISKLLLTHETWLDSFIMISYWNLKMHTGQVRALIIWWWLIRWSLPESGVKMSVFEICIFNKWICEYNFSVCFEHQNITKYLLLIKVQRLWAHLLAPVEGYEAFSPFYRSWVPFGIQASNGFAMKFCGGNGVTLF